MYNSHGEGSSTDPFAKCTDRHNCCASGSHSHDLQDENSWISSEGDCTIPHSSENRGTSRSSLKDCDSAPSSIDSPKKTNCHIDDHTYDHTHDHKCYTAHSQSHKPPKISREPPSKAEYLFGVLVPPPPTYSSPCTPIPTHLLYRAEPPKKAFLSPAGIGPITWNRPGESVTNQSSAKQGSPGNVSAPESQRVQVGSPRREVPIRGILENADSKQANVGQEISRQESIEMIEFENGLSRLEIHEDIVTKPIGTTPRQPCDPSHAPLKQAVKKSSVRFDNSEHGNSERIEPTVSAKKHLRQVRFDESQPRESEQEDVLTAHRSKGSYDLPINQQSDARLPRPTHILPPTLNSSPGFSGFFWHDETGFLDKNVLEERYKTSQVLAQLLPNGYVQSRDRPSKAADSAERMGTPVEYSADALEPETLNSTWESFEFLLTDYRIVFLVDDSLSMAGPPWLLVSQIVPQIAPLCAKYSGAEGADIRFVNNHSGKTDQVGLDPRDVRTTEKATNLFPRTPEGKKNPIGLELKKILSPYVRRWKQHGFNEEKPVDVIILTASAPSDYKVCVKSIVDITKELDKLGAPPAQICIQFFQISKVPAVTNDMKKLSEELMRNCTGRKIVSTFLWDEQVEAEAWSANAVLDCVRKMVDRKFFEAPTKTIARSKVPSCMCCT